MVTKSELKYIQSLSDKKVRLETGCFIAEGVKLVGEMIAAGYPLKAVYALDSWESPDATLEVTRIEAFELEKMSTFTFEDIKSKKVIKELKTLAKKANKIYIATDPDREGEAIGWHISMQLDLDVNDNNRVVFSEITKDAVIKGIENVHTLDMELVHSQEARRMIDRIIGFKLSKLLQQKIKAKSAGRVQSVALRMIVEREEEIRLFIPVEYWKLFANTKDLQLEYVGNDKKVSFDEIEELYNKCSQFNKHIIHKNIYYENINIQYIAGLFGVITLMVIIYNYFADGTVDSMWCWIVNSIMIYFFILSI